MDPQKRVPYYWRIQEILHDQLPIIETVRQLRYVAYRNTLKNFQPTVWGVYQPRIYSSSDRPTESPPTSTMARFLLRRILNMIPLLLGITFLSFLVMSLVPGNFLSNLKMNPSISPQLIKEMEAQFGLNQPLLVRYGKWLWAVLHLNLGTSLAFNVSVTSLIGSRAVQHDHLVGGEHAVRVDDRDSDRNHRRGQAELDLGSGSCRSLHFLACRCRISSSPSW